jgi:hypothetical protein
MKIKWLFIGLAVLPLACNLGPLILGTTPTETPTATATTTEIPTLAPLSTDTPAVSPTAYLIPTVVPSPTGLTCPKGTALNLSDNRCYYATRTPRPQDIHCPDYANKAACLKHGCTWNPSGGECK